MTSAGACDRRARPAAPSYPDRDRRRDVPLSSLYLQSQAVIRIERSLAGCRTKILIQRLGTDRVVVGLIFEQCEFRAGLWLLRVNGFMLGQGRLEKDCYVRRVFVGWSGGYRGGRGRHVSSAVSGI